MMPAEWAILPQLTWQQQHSIVEREVRAHFAANPRLDGEYLTTAELVEALFPERFAKGDGLVARNLIFKRLLAKGKPGQPMWQDAFRYQGPERHSGMMRGTRPWYWRAPTVDPERAAFIAAVQRAPEYADTAIIVDANTPYRDLLAFATHFINNIVDATEPANG